MKCYAWEGNGCVAWDQHMAVVAENERLRAENAALRSGSPLRLLWIRLRRAA